MVAWQMPGVPAAAVLQLIDVRGRWLYRLLRLAGIPVLRLLFRIEVVGAENLPRQGAYIAAANHLNWLDVPLLLIAFPIVPRLNFVADATFLTASRFKLFVVRAAGGVLPLVWHGHGVGAALETVKACLERGAGVGFFPEGSYGPDEATLMPFHHGFARAAIESDVPVVPVRLSGTKEVWLRKRVTVTIGRPLDPDGHTPDTLTEATRERITEILTAPQRPSGRRLFKRFLTRLF